MDSPPPLEEKEQRPNKPIGHDNEKKIPMEEEEEKEIKPSSSSQTLTGRKSIDNQEDDVIVLEEDHQNINGRASAASPRRRKTRSNARRQPRRHLLLKEEEEVQEEEEEEERHQIVKRKRKKSGNSSRSSPSKLPKKNKDNLSLVVIPPSSASDALPKIIIDDENQSTNSIWGLVSDIVMWKDVTKSTLWFGLGSTFFISCCFSSKSNFSIISAASHLGILILGVAFLNDSLSKRQTERLKKKKFQLTEDDLLRAVRLVLPLANSVLAKSQEVFSGEPLMTLKVAPLLLFTAKFGQLMTPWRLFAMGFLLSFTVPKVYSCYSERIREKVEETKKCLGEAWNSCPNKKLVAASTATVLWNMFSVKMRIFVAFISVVALRYRQQDIGEGSGEKDSDGFFQGSHQKAGTQSSAL